MMKTNTEELFNRSRALPRRWIAEGARHSPRVGCSSTLVHVHDLRVHDGCVQDDAAQEGAVQENAIVSRGTFSSKGPERRGRGWRSSILAHSAQRRDAERMAQNTWCRARNTPSA